MLHYLADPFNTKKERKISYGVVRFKFKGIIMSNYSAVVTQEPAWYEALEKEHKNTEMENLRHDAKFYFCAKHSTLSKTKLRVHPLHREVIKVKNLKAVFIFVCQ
jgi:hypothetical protein